jgi:hypothetical protein
MSLSTVDCNLNVDAKVFVKYTPYRGMQHKNYITPQWRTPPQEVSNPTFDCNTCDYR